MRISHVIRAEEHLSNTPRQVFIAQGLGYPLPEYAHLPYVAEPGSKNKLSKRKIAQYLKNPDFKKLYEHGKAIAERVSGEGLVVSGDARFGTAPVSSDHSPLTTHQSLTPENFNPVLVE